MTILTMLLLFAYILHLQNRNDFNQLLEKEAEHVNAQDNDFYFPQRSKLSGKGLLYLSQSGAAVYLAEWSRSV